MTTDRMALRELLEKGSDVDVLREMLGYVTQRLMDLEVAGLCGAGHGERTLERINHRNGYRDRLWETRAGGRVADPQAAQGLVLSWLPGAPAHGGKGVGGRGPRGLRAGCLDPQRR